MKIQIVDNGRRQEQPFFVLSAENFEERELLSNLLSYKEAILFTNDGPSFEVSVYLDPPRPNFLTP